MGLFSALCNGCKNPILPTFNTEVINAWMSDCVAIYSDGTRVRGFYDGYGRLDNEDGDCVAGDEDGSVEPVCCWTSNNDGPTVWHAACWYNAGQPKRYEGQSAHAPDQGHFFDEGTYYIPEPEVQR